jgi:CBS domain-containing protein
MRTPVQARGSTTRYFQRSVGEYMSTPAHCVTDDTSLPEVYRVLEGHRVSAMPVLDARRRVVGMLSRTDLLEVGVVRKGGRWQRASLDLPEQPARDAMTRNPLCIEAGSTVAETVELMLHERVHRVCVLEQRRLDGVFSTRDAMRAVVDDRIPTPLSALMTVPVASVRAVDPVERALERLATAGVHTLIVTEGDLPIGVFGQTEALLAQRSTTPSRVEDWADPRLLCLPPVFPVHRAAAQAVALHADAIVVMHDHTTLGGVVTASDIARAGLPPALQDKLRSRSSFR